MQVRWNEAASTWREVRLNWVSSELQKGDANVGGFSGDSGEAGMEERDINEKF